MVAIFSSVMDEKKGRGHSLKPSATLQDRGAKLTNVHRMHSLEAFTASPLFRTDFRLQQSTRSGTKRANLKLSQQTILYIEQFLFGQKALPLCYVFIIHQFFNVTRLHYHERWFSSIGGFTRSYSFYSRPLWLWLNKKPNQTKWFFLQRSKAKG